MEILVEKKGRILTAKYVAFEKPRVTQSSYNLRKTKTLEKLAWSFRPKIEMLKYSWEISLIIFCGY